MYDRTQRWLMLPVLAAFLAALVSPPAAQALAQVAAQASAQALAKSCDMRVSKGPWIYQSGSDVKTTAELWVICDVPPKSHHLEPWLERDVTDSGNWLLQGGVVHDYNIPPPTGDTVWVEVEGCISCKWRVMARATGIGPNGKPFRFDLPIAETRPTRLTCPGG